MQYDVRFPFALENPCSAALSMGYKLAPGISWTFFSILFEPLTAASCMDMAGRRNRVIYAMTGLRSRLTCIVLWEEARFTEHNSARW